MQLAGLPHPLKLVARFAVVGTVVLWLSHAYERPIVEPLLPALRAVVSFLDDNFAILGVDIAREGANETVRVRANFAHPVYVAGRVLYPMGLDPKTAGWMQVNLTLGSVLQYPLLVLIIVLSWPAATAKEMMLRLAMTLPTLVLLSLIDLPLTVLAEFWFPVRQDLDPHGFWPLLAWSRLLMGGGGVAISLVFGVGLIVYAAKLTARTHTKLSPSAKSGGLPLAQP